MSEGKRKGRPDWSGFIADSAVVLSKALDTLKTITPGKERELINRLSMASYEFGGVRESLYEGFYLLEPARLESAIPLLREMVIGPNPDRARTELRSLIDSLQHDCAARLQKLENENARRRD